MGQAFLKDCPICGKKATERFWPFCSLRCANIDLGNWLSERYVIHTDEKPSEQDSESAEE